MATARTASARTASARAGSVRAGDDGIVPATGAATRPRTGQGAGIVVGIVSAACFGTSGTFGSALISAGWSPAGAVLARVTVAALALTVPAVLTLRGRWGQLRRSAARWCCTD